jgi:hypothetical protein
MKYLIASVYSLLIIGLIGSHLAGTGDVEASDGLTGTEGLEALAIWLTGSFSSEQQSLRDSTYFDIRLHMVPIWRDRSDGPWLYVEQAAASALDQPYRQRVYRLSLIDDTTFRSAVYSLEEPLRFAGAWSGETPLAEISPDSLMEREGCAITLHPEGDSVFVGGTRDKSCASTLRGARYATSEVRLTRFQLYSWDRGFDSTGVQVWGAENGGYVFDRIGPEK